METQCKQCKRKVALEKTRPVNGTNERQCITCTLNKKWQKSKCCLKGCKTPARLVKPKNLPLRYKMLTATQKVIIEEKFGICGQTQCCKGCYTKVHKAVSDIVQKQPVSNTTIPATATYSYNISEQPTRGRPTAVYASACKKTKKKMEKQAKLIFSSAIKNAKDEVKKLASGREDLVETIGCFNTSSMESKEEEEKNNHYTNIISGLALSYSRATKSEERIRILSCVANQLTNKDLKAKFHYKTNCENEVSCTDYEITQARLHSQIFGPGLEKPPHKQMPRQFYTPVEDIAFLLDFIHSSDCVEPSSYRTATCIFYKYPTGNFIGPHA